MKDWFGQGSWFQDQWDHSPSVVRSRSLGCHGAREVELPVFLVVLEQVRGDPSTFHWFLLQSHESILSTMKIFKTDY